jgi:hypothetical protein
MKTMLLLTGFIVPIFVILRWRTDLNKTIHLLLAPTVFFLIALCVIGVTKLAVGMDVQILNGHVTDKLGIKRNCPDGWNDSQDDHCTNYTTREVVDYVEEVCATNSEGEEVCDDVPHFKTQYRYDFDWERRYFVYSTLKNFEIPRIDAQGNKEPPRYTITEPGEPVSTRSRYTNYLLLADQNVINPALLKLPEEISKELPDYPANVYDYWRLDRFITVASTQDITKLNRQLAELNSRVGPLRQANVIVIVTTRPQAIREEIYRKWNGGKKNDIIVLFGLRDNIIDWVDGITFLNNKGNEYLIAGFKEFNGKEFDNDVLPKLENMIVERFNREPMENIKHIADNYDLPPTFYFCAAIINLLLGIAATYLLVWRKQ